MSILDTCSAHWRQMSPADRKLLLDVMAANSPAWDPEGKRNIDLAGGEFDALPSDISGRLILAISEDGFDVAEYRAVRDTLIHTGHHKK